jgi:hypothetical protein
MRVEYVSDCSHYSAHPISDKRIQMFGLISNPYFDRSIVLTAATKGPGPALARALIARGAKLIAIDRDRDALDRLADDLGGGVVSLLSRDLAEPAAPVEVARWLADEHRDIGGFLCNSVTNGGGLTARMIAPLSILGFLDAFLPQRSDLKIALVLAASPMGQDGAWFSGLAQAFGWKNGGTSSMTTALLTARDTANTDGTGRRDADLILDALAKGRATVRVPPGRALPIPPRPGRKPEMQGERCV